MVATLHHILGIEGIDRLKTVVMAHYNHVAVAGVISRKAHRTSKHSLHGIALSGFYLHASTISSQHLTHRQRKAVFLIVHLGKVYLKRTRLTEQSRRLNTYLLLLQCRKIISPASRQHTGEKQSYYKEFLHTCGQRY